jgi:hypothetical protein
VIPAGSPHAPGGAIAGDTIACVAVDYGGYAAAVLLSQWYPKDRQMPRGAFEVLAGEHRFLACGQGRFGE